MNCQAVQYSDQMICDRCGLQWDVNDPEPPACVADLSRAEFDSFMRRCGSPRPPTAIQTADYRAARLAVRDGLQVKTPAVDLLKDLTK